LQKFNQIIEIKLLTSGLLEILVLGANFQGANGRFAPLADADAYHRNFKCIFEDLLPCYCYPRKASSKTIRSRVSQPAFAGEEADLMNCKLITSCYQNVNLTLVQCECHIGKQTFIARINSTNQN